MLKISQYQTKNYINTEGYRYVLYQFKPTVLQAQEATMNIILIFTLGVGFASAKYIVKYSLEDASAHFEEFIKTYNKQYDETEKAVRYKIFVKNLEKINKYNEISNHTEFGKFHMHIKLLVPRFSFFNFNFLQFNVINVVINGHYK